MLDERARLYLTDRQHITINAGGVDVIGEVLQRTHRLIVVALVEPYGQLRTSLTVPLLGCGVVDLTGEEGDELAPMLVTKLYRQAEYMTQNARALRSQWAVVEQHMKRVDEVHPGSPSLLRLKRLELRQALRSRDVDANGYQRAMKQLRRFKHEYEGLRTIICDSFSEPILSSLGTEQILRFIMEVH